MECIRWRRYGKDRLYVRDAQGNDIGWWDLITDEPHPANDGRLPMLVEAVQNWRSQQALATAVRHNNPAAPMTSSDPQHPPQLGWVDGVAGGSAADEFRRRHDARRERVQAEHPRIGNFLLAVFDDPPSTKAWSRGAAGENALGQVLEPIAGPGLRVLHDRRIPGSRANIDHLVIGSSGVFVVDAKRYAGQRPQLRVEGGVVRPRVEKLLVGGRDRSSLVGGMHKQVGLVRAALADRPQVPVHGVLCFVQAEWPLLGGDFSVEGVSVLWPQRLAQWVTNPGPLQPDHIAELQWRLHEAFPR
ncbi:nuclease-related domain-containing protein [Propionibacteriaceae bacterium G1746]